MIELRRPLTTLAIAASLLLAAGTASGQRLDLRLLRQQPRSDEQPLSLLVAASSPEALSEVRGLRLRACAAGICTAEALPDELDRVAFRQQAVLIERSGRRRPLLDRALPREKITNKVRRLGFNGREVLITFINSGID